MSLWFLLSLVPLNISFFHDGLFGFYLPFIIFWIWFIVMTHTDPALGPPYRRYPTLPETGVHAGSNPALPPNRQPQKSPIHGAFCADALATTTLCDERRGWPPAPVRLVLKQCA